MISVSHISKKYENFLAVKDVSFEIHSGKIFGFLGPNGAGKSTTMKILTGYIPPSTGKASIAGYSVGSIESKKNIGYLAENNPLYTDMTVYEYLQWTASIYDIHNTKTAIDRAMILCGLVEKRHKLIGNLSKGYKQRTGLAASIIHNPKVLILDEPTTGLDPLQIIEIRSLIKELGKEHTILLSTHIMQEAEAVCDEVIIINNGQILAQGTPTQLSKGLSNTIKMRLEGNTYGIIEKFKEIDFVSDVIEIQKDGSIKIFEIVIGKTMDDHIIKRELYQIIKSNDVILHELTTKNADMENIFVNIVKK